MAKQAFLTTNCKALNFTYKVPTTEFDETDAVNGEKHYKVDLAVDKHPEYPNIPPSVWTVTLSIGETTGTISEKVEPKAVPESLKIPYLVLMDSRVRMGKLGEKEGDSGDYYKHMGPQGFKKGCGDQLHELLAGYNVPRRKWPRSPITPSHRLVRHPGVYVFISLTFTVPTTSVNRVLENLYQSGMLADFKLVCGGREFPAHRAVLAVQSPVFATMFQTEMKEKASGICTIKDTDPDVLEALLQFAYTKELSKADGKLELLWNAADKYDMQDLKRECERLMFGSVIDENASRNQPLYSD